MYPDWNCGNRFLEFPILRPARTQTEGPSYREGVTKHRFIIRNACLKSDFDPVPQDGWSYEYLQVTTVHTNTLIAIHTQSTYIQFDTVRFGQYRSQVQVSYVLNLCTRPRFRPHQDVTMNEGQEVFLCVYDNQSGMMQILIIGASQVNFASCCKSWTRVGGRRLEATNLGGSLGLSNFWIILFAIGLFIRVILLRLVLCYPVVPLRSVHKPIP